MATSDTLHRPGIPRAALVPFFLVTFAITWSIIGGYILVPELAVATFGQISGSHPLYFVATWAPAIAAVIVVGVHAGLDGLRAFLSRLLLWRGPAVWWAFILVGIPAVFMAGSLIKGGPLIAPLPPEGLGPVVSLMAMMLFLGPVEELGWRGVAQPLLQRMMAPFWAGALIGTAWGIWHLPAFFLAGVVFEEWSFLPFFIGNVALAILVTPILNAGRGGLLLPVLFHWQLINPVWPDAQPWDTWLLAGAAAAIAWWKRDLMFSREGAVTEVLPRRPAAGH